MITLIPNSWGSQLRELNTCHGKGRGHPCHGGATSTAPEGPPAGPHIGLVEPGGVYHMARDEDHTDLARRLLKNEDAGVREALDAGYVRYWIRRGEVAINFQAGRPEAARNALTVLHDYFTPGDSIYLDVEPMRGVHDPLDFPHFFKNVREANEVIRRVANLTLEQQKRYTKAA